MKKINTNSAKLFLIVSLFSGLVITGCQKSQEVTKRLDTPKLPSAPYQYLTVQEGITNIEISNLMRDGSDENLSNESVTLGRVLFYDTKLSINNTIACGSCHKQSLGFADNVNFSTGFSNKLTARNSMSIQNVVTNNNMFWDSRAQSPLELSLMPVFNHLEMGIESDEMLVSKLSQTSYYPALFEDAFGSRTITREKISLAITQFINCLFSKQSKFDQGIAASLAVGGVELKDIEPNNFTPLELYGKKLFFSAEFKCSQCHFGTNFSAPDFVGGGYGSSGGGGFSGNNEDPKGTANIGLDMVYKDNGKNNGRFKIPSLRNIELTAPYMHDGRFQTLEDVVNHYSHGIKAHPNLDEKFRKNGQAVKLNISESDKVALISFLKTLTDNHLVTNPKFSDPFVAN